MSTKKTVEKGVKKPEKSKGSLRPEHAEWAHHDTNADNILALPSDLKAELMEKEFAYRFINKTELSKNNGIRKGGWKPYKLTNTEKLGAFSGSSDGYLHRGDLVLAVRPNWLHEAEKAKIEARTKVQSNRQDKKAADELRKIFTGVSGVNVTDGDDV